MKGKQGTGEKQKIRYAVVGLGYIAQVAVLPAFENAKKNSELTALVSDDAEKLAKLSRKYKVKQTCSYDEYDELLQSGKIDAVYIALPNHLHNEYTIRAARAGVHVLCEKPMAVTDDECIEMIRACKENKVKLMIAYRLHFDKANLSAIEVVNSGKIGEPRIFNSVFTMQVKDKDNIRLKSSTGGGTVYDIGIYCINAARYLFQDEPIEVTAVTANSGDERFTEVEEMAGAVLRFPEDRLASFTCSFGAADVSAYEVVGTEGTLRMDPAYEYAGDLRYTIKIKDKERERTFPKHDQFGPELLYFSNCVLNNEEPEPSGREGLADVRIIQAIYESAETRRPVKLELARDIYPDLSQEISRPPIKEPELVNAASPSGE
ncbi:MAG: Gfo/Idh/MocA family oxidoreductase [Acidobacteriota bacterium]|nr:Gfo/Idh/MocA family oxidoreductase [Acidobacteriota bacterium]